MSDQIKEAFQKVKEDILFLKNEISFLKNEIKLLNSFLIHSFPKEKGTSNIPLNTIGQLSNNNNFFDSNQKNNLIYSKNQFRFPTNQQINPTNQQINPTNQQINPTSNNNINKNLPFKDLKSINFNFSTGNEGVPTNRQTNQQTNQQTIIIPYKSSNNNSLQVSSSISPSLIIEQLDTLKKELRFKFKRLTSQEFTVFSLIYQLEEQNIPISYTLLSKKLGLTESSVRDYIKKIIGKGIPIIKEKINNKKVLIHLSPDLKKLASLDTIIKLREL